MVLTAQELGDRIASARHDAQITQAYLADQIGINRSAVAKIEKGERRVDSLELMAISEVTDRPLEFFLEQEQPLEVHFRSHEAANPQIQQQLEWLKKFMTDYDFLKELTDGSA